MQILHIGQGKYLRVLTSFADAGEGAVYGMVGGQRVVLSKGQKPHPEIFKCEGNIYVYKNGAPVDNVDDVEWLPKKYREEALEFVKKEQKGVAPVFETKEAAITTPVVVKKGRGRPKKAVATAPKGGKKVIEIKDEASLLSVAGYDKE